MTPAASLNTSLADRLPVDTAVKTRMAELMAGEGKCGASSRKSPLDSSWRHLVPQSKDNIDLLIII